MKRIKLLVIVIIITLLFIGCGKTDPRLDGTYVFNINAETGQANDEIIFKGKNFINSSEIIRNGIVEVNQSFEYKIKIFSINDTGGSFYAILSTFPNSYFRSSNFRELYGYTFTKNGLILEREHPIGKRSYIRK